MEASLGRVWNLQLKICHAVAVAKQHPTLAGHEYRAREVPSLNEGLKISLQTIRYLNVGQVLTAPNTAKQEQTRDSQSAIERFHLAPLRRANRSMVSRRYALMTSRRSGTNRPGEEERSLSLTLF